MATPNMGLTQSTPLVTTGPAWAENIEADLLLIDQHDHTTGKGVQIVSAAININANLSFGSFEATTLKSIAFATQVSALLTPSRVYVVNGDLYYNNGASTAIQLTSGGAINVAGVGGITGLAGTTGAVTYSNSLKVFSFTQDASNSASLDAGTVTIRQPGLVAANGVSVKSPTSLAGSYDLTLFAALPGATKIVQLSAAGVMQDVLDVDNTTVEINSNNIRVKDAGISDAKLRNSVAVSVIGRSANSSGTPADIAAGADGGVLLRRTNAVSFATLIPENFAANAVETAAIDDEAVTLAKLATTTVTAGTPGSGTRTGAAPGSNDIEVTATIGSIVRNTYVQLVTGGGTNYISIADNGSGGGHQRFGGIGLYIDGVSYETNIISAYLADVDAFIGFPLNAFTFVLPPGAVTAGSRTFGIRFSSSGTNPEVQWVSVAVRVWQA